MIIFNVAVICLVFFYAGYKLGVHVIMTGLSHQMNDMLNDYSPEKRDLLRKAMKEYDKKHK